MGIVHHSNYLRFCEEARIQWCLKYGAMNDSGARVNTNAVTEGKEQFEHQSVFALTVVETRVQHKKAIKYPNHFKIKMQAKVDGIKIVFNYEILNNFEEICALVETVHCSVNEKLKPVRLSAQLLKATELSQAV